MSQATYAVMPEVEEMKAAGPRWYVADSHVVSPAEAFWGLVLWQLAVQWIAGFSRAAFIHVSEFLVPFGVCA